MSKQKYHHLTNSEALLPNDARALRNRESPSGDKVEPVLEPSCGNCPFWLRYDSTDVGQCRRYPPTIVDPSHLTVLGPLVRYGITKKENLCGEHPLISASRSKS